LSAARHRLSAETHDTDPDRGGNHINLIIEAVPGQADIRVRNDDAFESGVVELAPTRAFDKRFAVSSMPVDGKNHAPLGLGIAGKSWMACKRAGCKHWARDDRARRLQKVAPVHTPPFD
jgi:hypothetical protein